MTPRVARVRHGTGEGEGLTGGAAVVDRSSVARWAGLGRGERPGSRKIVHFPFIRKSFERFELI
jgi:hypothetical protein